MENLNVSPVLHRFPGIKDARKPVQGDDGTRSIRELLPGFLEYLHVEESCAPITQVRYRAYIERFAAETGVTDVRHIDEERIHYYKRRLIDQKLAAPTIALMLSALRSFLRYLQEVRRIEVFDPDKVRRPKTPSRKVDYLTKDEVARFRAGIPTSTFAGVRDRALVDVLLSTGMRINEALSLDRKDVGWETREAKVIGKGNKPRKVYFSEEALESLQQYLQFRHDEDPALFVTQGDRPVRLKAEGTWRRFSQYAKQAGIEKPVYPHMLRHTMATLLLANGCPIGHIRALLGHEQLSTTCRYYLGTIEDAEAKAAHAKYFSLRT